ncbi:RNA-directed DNA polymerase, eukaryota, reverse transcriptase zinc-binding domain protein [Tanacetum coccineum]
MMVATMEVVVAVNKRKGKPKVDDAVAVEVVLAVVVVVVDNAVVERRERSKTRDPNSPYLFTLVMEVLTLMMARKVHGSANSIKVIKEALNKFNKTSGLHPNMSKSTIFFGNMNNIEKYNLTEILPFRTGVLMKYLGVPLITKRLEINDCKCLVEKASVFLLSKSNVKEIDKVLKGFLWCQGEYKNGRAKVAWKTVYTPKKEGGLGLIPLNLKLKDKSVWEIEGEKINSCIWNVIATLKDKVRPYVFHKIGNGRSTSVWYDRWSNNEPLSFLIPKCYRNAARWYNNMIVADMIQDGRWQWPNGWSQIFHELLNIDVPVLQECVKDKILWKIQNGKPFIFSAKTTWEDLRCRGQNVKWNNMVWYSQGFPRQSFILWLAVKEKLHTLDDDVEFKQEYGYYEKKNEGSEP